MASQAAVSYRWQGPAILRASTNSGLADFPRTLSVDDAAVTRMWLGRRWQDQAFRDALRAATPVLAAAVEAVVSGRQTQPRQVRRTALSTISYLLRWQNRPTPLGLFAGTAAVAVGNNARTQWRENHRALLRADAEWVTDIIGGLQSSPELLRRLPLVANNTPRERGDRLVAVGAAGRRLRPAPGPDRDIRPQRQTGCRRHGCRSGADHLRQPARPPAPALPAGRRRPDRHAAVRPGRPADPPVEPVGADDHHGCLRPPVRRAGTTPGGHHSRPPRPGHRAVRHTRRHRRPPAGLGHRRAGPPRPEDARPHHRDTDALDHRHQPRLRRADTRVRTG